MRKRLLGLLVSVVICFLSPTVVHAGMIGFYTVVSESTLGIFQKAPWIMSAVLTWRTLGYYGALFWAIRKKDETALKSGLLNRPTICIQKQWHGIHFLLTGTKEGGKPPLSYVVLGGKEIGGDRGYGPAQYLTPAQVKEADRALQMIKVSDVSKKFDLKKMAAEDIYPLSGAFEHRHQPSEQDIEDEREGYMENIEFLKTYFHRAAQDNRAIIFWIS